MSRIVQARGVVILYLMNVIFVAVTTVFVQTVRVYQMVLLMKMNVTYVMMIHPI